jgi:opacity protein-like surface antigen
MKKIVQSIMVITMLITLCMAQVVHAQGKVNATFRPSVNFPVKDLGTTELKSGGGFEVNFSYRFMNKLSAYAGWGWSSFSPKQSENIVSHYEENGYRIGLQFIQPLSAESKLNLHLGAGGVGNHIEAENDEGDILDDSGHGMGWEVEAGLSIPVSKRWQIVPGIRYHSLSRDMTIDDREESVDLNYLSVGVGVSWTLVDR